MRFGLIGAVLLISTWLSPVLINSAVGADGEGAYRLCTLVFDHGVTLNGVPLAETSEQKRQGLSGSSDYRSMYFRWAEAAPRVVWMKETAMDLSVGFFGEEGVLFRLDDLQAYSEKHVFSLEPARAFLELPPGRFEQLGLGVGTTLDDVKCDQATQ